MKWSCLLVLLPFFLFFLKLKNLETKKKIHKIHNETPEPKKRPSGPRCLHRHNLRYKPWKNRRNLHGMKWYLHSLKFGQFHLHLYIYISISYRLSTWIGVEHVFLCSLQFWATKPLLPNIHIRHLPIPVIPPVGLISTSERKDASVFSNLGAVDDITFPIREIHSEPRSKNKKLGINPYFRNESSSWLFNICRILMSWHYEFDEIHIFLLCTISSPEKYP